MQIRNSVYIMSGHFNFWLNFWTVLRKWAHKVRRQKLWKANYRYHPCTFQFKLSKFVFDVSLPYDIPGYRTSTLGTVSVHTSSLKLCIKIEFCKYYFSPLPNNFTSKGKDPDPYIWLTDPDPEGPKTYILGIRNTAHGYCLRSTRIENWDVLVAWKVQIGSACEWHHCKRSWKSHQTLGKVINRYCSVYVSQLLVFILEFFQSSQFYKF